MATIKSKKKIREYWKDLYHSKRCKMTRGAQNIARMIHFAKDENWRRKEVKKTPKNK